MSRCCSLLLPLRHPVAIFAAGVNCSRVMTNERYNQWRTAGMHGDFCARICSMECAQLCTCHCAVMMSARMMSSSPTAGVRSVPLWCAPGFDLIPQSRCTDSIICDCYGYSQCLGHSSIVTPAGFASFCMHQLPNRCPHQEIYSFPTSHGPAPPTQHAHRCPNLPVLPIHSF